jgi:hypothetical protein|tara:strand:- start:4302 stop:4658 length:357 start_codon:yes stop_codon:yes gene_type:complete
MNIDYEAKLLALYTIPEQDGETNIVKKVTWKVEFFDTDFRNTVNSHAEIVTRLNTDTLASDFVSYESLTHEVVLQLCLDHEGGSAFLENLESHHESSLAVQYADRNLTIRPVAELAQS